MGVPNNWIRFNSTTHLITKDGSTFKLMRAEGIEPDKKFYFPENGKATFTFIFKAVADFKTGGTTSATKNS